MVFCPSCRSQQMNGTIFCAECGTDLQNPAVPTFDLNSAPAPVPLKTSAAHSVRSVSGAPGKTPVPPPRSNLPPSSPEPPRSPTAASSNGSSRRSGGAVLSNFSLMVLNSGRTLECPDLENVIIGRSDAMTGDKPDIDLTPDNAIELGVSRRHACITFRDSHPYLTDLGSTNRTFLNRQQMMRGQPYEIQDGDEVRLGNVILKVMFNRTGSRR